jgi:hypothetical protein
MGGFSLPGAARTRERPPAGKPPQGAQRPVLEYATRDSEWQYVSKTGLSKPERCAGGFWKKRQRRLFQKLTKKASPKRGAATQGFVWAESAHNDARVEAYDRLYMIEHGDMETKIRENK